MLAPSGNTRIHGMVYSGIGLARERSSGIGAATGWVGPWGNQKAGAELLRSTPSVCRSAGYAPALGFRGGGRRCGDGVRKHVPSLLMRSALLGEVGACVNQFRIKVIAHAHSLLTGWPMRRSPYRCPVALPGRSRLGRPRFPLPCAVAFVPSPVQRAWSGRLGAPGRPPRAGDAHWRSGGFQHPQRLLYYVLERRGGLLSGVFRWPPALRACRASLRVALRLRRCALVRQRVARSLLPPLAGHAANRRSRAFGVRMRRATSRRASKRHSRESRCWRCSRHAMRPREA